MIHLTLTGYYAGTPFCGVNKQEAKERGDKFYHGMYFHDFDNPELCPDCKKEWFDEVEDEEMRLDRQERTGRCSECGKPVLQCICE